MKKTLSVIIGLAVNFIPAAIVAGLTWYWNVLPWYAVLILVLLVLAVEGLIFFLTGFRRIGITDSSKRRGDSQKFAEILQDARSSVDFLVSWGGSLPGLSRDYRQQFEEMVSRGVKIRILMLKPNSFGVYERLLRSAKWTRRSHINQIDAFIEFKENRITENHWDDFRIAFYEEEACWSMAIVDGRFASVGFYGEGVGRDHPSLELAKGKNPNLFDFFRETYETMWERCSTKNTIHTYTNFSQLLEADERRKRQGLVFCFIGPCGAGKTSIVNKLLDRHNFRQIKTTTTRRQRDASEAVSQYNFVTSEEFDSMIAEGGYVTARYCDNRYAISRDDIAQWRNGEEDFIMDSIFDADDLREAFGNRLVLIYVTASTKQIMIDRVRGRFKNSVSLLQLRKEHADVIAASAPLCDYILITDGELDDTLDAAERIIKAAKKSYAEYGRVRAYDSDAEEFLADRKLDGGQLPRVNEKVIL